MMQNYDNSIKICVGSSFCAALGLAGLATVSVLLFEKEEYCRAGGKPSTGFSPGTRRAEPAFYVLPLRDLHTEAFNWKFPDADQFLEIFPKFSEIFIIFSTFSKTHTLVVNQCLIELES